MNTKTGMKKNICLSVKRYPDKLLECEKIPWQITGVLELILFFWETSVNFSEMTSTKCFQLALISFLIFKRTHTYEESCGLSSIGFMVNSPWEMSPIIFIRTWGRRTQLLLRNRARIQIPTAWFKSLPSWSPSYTANYWPLSWKAPWRTVLRENKLSLHTTDQNNVFFDE